MTQKAILRKNAVLQREAFTGELRRQANEALCSRLCRVLEDLKVQRVYTFVSYGSEADTHGLLHWCFEHHISAAVPRVEGNYIHFYKITSMKQLVPGCRGILEPNENCPEALAELKEHAAVIVPGLLFDERGNRLGYGGGYYDRFLAEHRDMFRIGIGFDIQMTEQVLTEPHDEALDMILTEQRQVVTGRKGWAYDYIG